MERDLVERAGPVPRVTSGTARPPVPGRAGAVLGLQRTAGNAAVSRAVEERRGGDVAAGVQREGLGDVFGPSPFGGGPEQQGGSDEGGGTATEPAPPAGVNELGPVARTGTLIADTVVASSYTPGAGNIW